MDITVCQVSQSVTEKFLTRNRIEPVFHESEYVPTTIYISPLMIRTIRGREMASVLSDLVELYCTDLFLGDALGGVGRRVCRTEVILLFKYLPSFKLPAASKETDFSLADENACCHTYENTPPNLNFSSILESILPALALAYMTSIVSF